MKITLVDKGHRSRNMASSPLLMAPKISGELTKQRVRNYSSGVFKGSKQAEVRIQNHSVNKFTGSCEILKSTAHKSDLNENSIKATAEKNLSGRLSFKGASVKVASSFAEKVVQSKYFAKFMDFARENPAVFEAVGAIGICCGLRPLAIMAMPDKDRDKNRKAASHSIASGVMGYIFSYLLYNHFSKAMGKIETSVKEGNIGKYLDQSAKYLVDNKEGLQSGVYKTFNQLATYGPKLATAFVLGAATVGIMPYIDKYIIDKYILKPKNGEKATEINEYDSYKYITFRSNSNRNRHDKVFQNFKGVMR